MNIYEPVPFAQWKNDARNTITISDLMHMSSGLNWWEFYAAPSDCTNMLFNEKSMGEFAIRSSLATSPGSVFNYSSGSANMLSYLIRLSLGDSIYYKFPYEQLFYRAGMYSAVLEQDAGGTFIGSSYCYATARDWARFGLLYLNDGIINGERIFPEGWVSFTRTPTKAKDEQKRGYGALWWLNKRSNTDNNDKVHPDVPSDAYACLGYEGQSVWVIPSKKLVVVRMALEKKHKLDPNDFLPGIIKAVE
jgi:hypothetical protein